MEELSRKFRAMNTDVLAIVSFEASRRTAAESALDEVERLFERNEAAMSRFRPESELSRLNRSAGRPFRASSLLLRVVLAAVNAARTTNGAFDPTVLKDLIAAGYDRSFELLAEQSPGAPTDRPGRVDGRASCSWRDVHVDTDRSSITLPGGCAIDLGGIGKGWTVDQAAAGLRSFQGYAIDAGGDIYAAGAQGNGDPWTVGISDPFDPGRDLTVLAVSDRAVATSTTSRRRWVVEGGREMHHLIDPRTGLPGNGDVISATVVADSVARAEVLAKTALLLGSVEGPAFLAAQQGMNWMLVLANGNVNRSAGLPEVQYAG